MNILGSKDLPYLQISHLRKLLVYFPALGYNISILQLVLKVRLKSNYININNDGKPRGLFFSFQIHLRVCLFIYKVVIKTKGEECASFEIARITNSEFRKCNMAGVNMRASYFLSSEFYGVRLKDARLTSARFVNSILEDSHYSGERGFVLVHTEWRD